MSIGEIPLASYSYDAVGRVSGINKLSFGYLANSNLLSTVTRPNNVNATWSYEANRNLVTGVENKLNDTVISNYAYTNDALGRRTAMARSGSVFTAGDTLSYNYNDRSDVTGVSSNASNTTYNYAYSFDNIGNRLAANLAGTPWTYIANNCSSFASDAWNSMTGEYLSPSNGFLHSPGALEDSIQRANGDSSDNWTGATNSGRGLNNHATSSSDLGPSGSSSNFSGSSSSASGNSASSSVLPMSSINSSL